MTRICKYKVYQITEDAKIPYFDYDGDEEDESFQNKYGVSRFVDKIKSRGGSLFRPTKKSADSPTPGLRVNGNLNLLTNIGYISCKLPAQPMLRMVNKTYPIRSKGPCFLVQVCDGITDVFSTNDIGDIVKEFIDMYGDPDSLKWGCFGKDMDEDSPKYKDFLDMLSGIIAAYIVKYAYQLGSQDNLTAMVKPVYF